jgi:hypothetical protein
MYFSTESQIASATGIATSSATVELSSRSRPARIRQHSAYSSPVSERFRAMAAWNRRNGDRRRATRYMTSGMNGPRKIAAI